MLVHHHLIYQAEVSKVFWENKWKELEVFLYNLINHIDMEVLIEPRLAYLDWIEGGRTWIVWIVTSHISFHYRIEKKYVQLDIYSCKEFNSNDAIDFLNEFWWVNNYKWLRVNRNTDQDFVVMKV